MYINTACSDLKKSLTVVFSVTDTEPFPRYVSVKSSSNSFTSAIYYLLLYFTGLRSPFKSEKCSGNVDEVGYS